MRELVIVADRSDSTLLTLQLVGTSDGDNVFTLAVTDELRNLIAPGQKDTTAPVVVTDEARPAQSASDPLPENTTASRPDPRLSKPLPMTPREIQDEIRRGASVADVADKCDLPESRIAPFAYPVLQERARIAELAKSSRPVRSDGPCPLTLAELTATALSAQGEDVAAATWDARRDHSNQWVIVVTYGTDQGQSATWTLVKNAGSYTTVPSDQAAHLITEPSQADQPPAAVNVANDDDTDDGTGGITTRPRQDDGFGQDVLIPELGGSSEPRRRKRKAETPHWEDVLLSVRSSTKRPRK